MTLNNSQNVSNAMFDQVLVLFLITDLAEMGQTTKIVFSLRVFEGRGDLEAGRVVQHPDEVWVLFFDVFLYFAEKMFFLEDFLLDFSERIVIALYHLCELLV